MLKILIPIIIISIIITLVIIAIKKEQWDEMPEEEKAKKFWYKWNETDIRIADKMGKFKY